MVAECSRCLFTDDIPGVVIEDGVCNFCRIHDRMNELYPLGEEGKRRLDDLVEKIKRQGRGKPYDCIAGVSGGTDSTYMLYLAVKQGLRPLAVHFDNHWNSEIAEENMRNACERLGIDLRIVAVDWDEFRDIQMAFLKASIPDVEIPTDLGALAIQYRVADEVGVKYILMGHSFRAEGVAPLAWSNLDGRYLVDIHRRFGSIKLHTFPNLTLFDILNYTFVKGIKIVHILDYVEYDKASVRELLRKECGWEYYGGHHLESLYTRWVTNYYIPNKFGIDKRVLAYSAAVRSGHLSKSEAIKLLNEHIPDETELTRSVLLKLGLSKNEFNTVMNAPVKNFKQYRTYYPVLSRLAGFVRFFNKTGLLGDIGYTFIEKYQTF